MYQLTYENSVLVIWIVEIQMEDGFHQRLAVSEEVAESRLDMARGLPGFVSGCSRPEFVEDKPDEPPYFEVLVGNIGCVYSGNDHDGALKDFHEYVSQSMSGYGRAGNESVVLIRDGEPINGHYPGYDDENSDEEFEEPETGHRAAAEDHDYRDDNESYPVLFKDRKK